MKIIDRYIILKFLTTFFFCLILFLVIIVVIDLSERTDDFVKADLTFWQIVTDYYAGLIPRLGSMLFPLFVFISVIFFTSKMAGRSEVIAILSSGVSFRRFMLPFVLGGLFLSGLLWLGYQFIIPKANRKWADFDIKYLSNNARPNLDGKRGSYKTNVYFKLDSLSYIGLKGYDTVSKSGSNFFVQRYVKNRLVYNLRASNILWDTANKNWKLGGVQERFLDSINERIIISDQKVFNYNFKPIDLRNDDYLKEQMTTSQLDNFIKAEEMRGSPNVGGLLVERYNRDAIPASCLILTIIGVSLASRKVRGGSGAHLALGVLISVMYILFSRISVVFATQGDFSPFLAAWTPNIAFGMLALYIYYKAPK